MDAGVVAAPVASQAERVERGVVEPLGGEPGAHGGHVAQTDRDVDVAVEPPRLAPGGDPGNETSLEAGNPGEPGAASTRRAAARLVEGGPAPGAPGASDERESQHGLAVVAGDLPEAEPLVEARGGVGALHRERQRGAAKLGAPLKLPARIERSASSGPRGCDRTGFSPDLWPLGVSTQVLPLDVLTYMTNRLVR